jgi:hypothetical protein
MMYNCYSRLDVFYHLAFFRISRAVSVSWK